MSDNYIRKVKEVVRILDGDSVELCINLGHHTYHTSVHRLDGFDAPETWRPINEIERTAGEKVTAYLKSVLEQYKDNLYVQTSKDPKIYGRYTARLMACGVDANNASININSVVEEYMVANDLTKEQVRAYKE